MNGLPMVLNTAVWAVLGLIPVLLWQGQPASEILPACLLASVLSIFISVGILRWIGLPRNVSNGDYVKSLTSSREPPE